MIFGQHSWQALNTAPSICICNTCTIWNLSYGVNIPEYKLYSAIIFIPLFHNNLELLI